MTTANRSASGQSRSSGGASGQGRSDGEASGQGRSTRIEPRGDRPSPLVYKQGAHPPYSIRWYGATSLFGHFRNFIASAIASESVDSRDWMRPLTAEEILANVKQVLGLESRPGTLLEAKGAPLWIDFVADTGDDRDVSAAVGRMIFREHVVQEDGSDLVLPRGDILLMGGDTAYPVATADEIFRRVVEPWNEVLREVHEAQGTVEPSRVLLGIPGNHDWYDGLDGFGRFFRKRPKSSERTYETLRPGEKRRSTRATRSVGLVARGLHLDEVGGAIKMIAEAGKTVTAFFRGTKVARRRHLALDGYESVQESSFWALPLAPALDLWGVDRQLGRLDYRQRGYFQDRRHAVGREARVWFIAPDPAIAFGETYEPGARMLSACQLSFERDRLLYLSGDLHHYERRPPINRALSVIAGGGGAFLHGTRITPPASGPAACAYPDAAATRQLVVQMPLKLMLGRAGYLVHIALALIASVDFGAGLEGGRYAFRGMSVFLTILIGLLLYGIAGHQRTHPARVLGIAIPYALLLGLMPWGLAAVFPRVVPLVERGTAVIVVYAFLGALVFGLFLATLAVTGIELQQAFTVLGHPGFKHFVRLRVAPDGKIDAWVIGKDDPLAAEGPWLIDRWSWDGGEARTSAEASARFTPLPSSTSDPPSEVF
jgi:hypothetical protein